MVQKGKFSAGAAHLREVFSWCGTLSVQYHYNTYFHLGLWYRRGSFQQARHIKCTIPLQYILSFGSMVQKGKFSTGTAHLVYNTITIRTFIWVYGTEGEVFNRHGTFSVQYHYNTYFHLGLWYRRGSFQQARHI